MAVLKCYRIGCDNQAAENWVYCSLECQEKDRPEREGAEFVASVAAHVKSIISSGRGIVAQGEPLGFPPEGRRDDMARGADCTDERGELRGKDRDDGAID